MDNLMDLIFGIVYQGYDSTLRRYARLDWQLFQDQQSRKEQGLKEESRELFAPLIFYYFII